MDGGRQGTPCDVTAAGSGKPSGEERKAVSAWKAVAHFSGSSKHDRG